MKNIQQRLLYIFWTPVALAALIAVLAETGIIDSGQLATYGQAEFYTACAMQLITIAAIPTALRLFKIKPIAMRLKAGHPAATLLRWGTARLLMLNIPMLANLVCYYLFMAAGFGYLAIILCLSLFFVYPSLSRCYNETDSSNS